MTNLIELFNLCYVVLIYLQYADPWERTPSLLFESSDLRKNLIEQRY